MAVPELYPGEDERGKGAMKAEAFITINFNGKYSKGDAAVAIVLKEAGSKDKYIKIFGFSNVSHQYAETLAAVRMIRMVKPGTDLTVTVGYPYSFIMMERRFSKLRVRKNLWQEFFDKVGQLSSMTVIYEKEHKFKQASIHATEKGGYKMEEMEESDGEEK